MYNAVGQQKLKSIVVHVLERDMQVHLALYVLIYVVFTLMKIFLKVDWPSVNEVKAGVKAKEDDKKNKTSQKELTIREASLLISYRKHQYWGEVTNVICCKILFPFFKACWILWGSCHNMSEHVWKTFYSIYWDCSLHMIGSCSSSVYPVTW